MGKEDRASCTVRMAGSLRCAHAGGELRETFGSCSCSPGVWAPETKLSGCLLPQYSLSTKRASPDDGNDVSPYSLSPVSNKR